MKVLRIVAWLLVSIALVRVSMAVSSVTRSKTILQNIRRHDAALPNNAQLIDVGIAFLNHPRSRPIITEYLAEHVLVINPADESKLKDIGTLSGGVFTPSNAATVNQYLATVYMRNLRQYHRDVIVAYEILTADAPALPISEARASIIGTAETDAAVIIGDNSDDPES